MTAAEWRALEAEENRKREEADGTRRQFSSRDGMILAKVTENWVVIKDGHYVTDEEARGLRDWLLELFPVEKA